MTVTRIAVEDRFWDKVDQSAGPVACWPWLGARHRKGYGHIWNGERMEKAHRVAARLTGTSIVPDLWVLHRCDNPPCCNPAHLYLGTNADNMRDMIAKGRQTAQLRRRTACRRGHELAGDNLLIKSTGQRACRTCCQLSQQRRRPSRTGRRDLAVDSLGRSA